MMNNETRLLTSKEAADYLSTNYWPISHRTLPRMPVRYKVVGRVRLFDKADLDHFVNTTLERTPVRMGGAA